MSNTRLVTSAALAALIVAAAAQTASAQSAAHRHIGHVADSWRDTPDQVGLLVAAQMEAEVAAQHAGLAAGSDDLAAIHRDVRSWAT